jgi:transposase
VRAKSFEDFYDLVKKASRSKIFRQKAEEIYVHAGNIFTIPELDSIMTMEIKTLIRQLELYEEQINSGIGETLGPIILGEIGNVDRFSSVKKLIAFAGIDPVVSQSGRFQSMSGGKASFVCFECSSSKNIENSFLGFEE